MSNECSLEKIYLQDFQFFLLEGDRIVVWNYLKNEQFYTDLNTFNCFFEISASNGCSDKKVQDELFKAALITNFGPKFSSKQWGWDELSKIFHFGTKNVYTDCDTIDYWEECEQTLNTDDLELFTKKAGAIIELPKPNLHTLSDTSFFDVINRRKTCRTFFKSSISLETLSKLLFASFGMIHEDSSKLNELGIKQTIIRKSSPSSAGLHAEEAYIINYTVDGLEPGIYHYQTQDHKLCLLNRGDFEEKVIQINYKQEYSRNLCFGVYLTCRFDKHWWKYKHSRQYRVALMDMGHVSQAFLLAATACNLNTWLTSSFQDSDVEELLGIKEFSEGIALFLGAGHGDDSIVPSQLMGSLI